MKKAKVYSLNQIFFYHGFLLLSFILQTTAAFSQNNVNLILNGGFEKAKACQLMHTTPGDPIKANHWFSPSAATPDLFNQCAFGEMAVPSNYVGKAYAVEGNNYAGLFFGYVGSEGGKSNYREYLLTQLLDTLIKKTIYHYSFYAKPATKSNYLNKYLTFAFSDSALNFEHDTLITGLSFVKIDTDTLPVEKGWYKIQGSFKAKGGEAYFLIGDLLRSNQTEYIPMHAAKYDRGKRVSSFYLFDDFKLFPAVRPQPYPMAEPFTLDSIFFAFNADEISPSKETALDPLISYMLQNEQLQLIILGNTDEVGSEAYNKDLSYKRAAAVRDYMIEKGVTEKRIKLVAKGESDLISADDALNRRTAFILREE